MEKVECKRIVKIYRDDPIRFFTDCLDVESKNVWDKMVAIVNSVRDEPKTAVKAAHSVSKTYTAARLALWFLYTFNPSTVITTAPIHKQVEEILWREIREAHANSKVPLGGTVTKTKIDISEKWFALGFSTKPDTVTQQATSFQGYHNVHVLIIFDEAAGILREIWEAADSLMAAGFCRFLAIGNPTAATGEFADCFKNPEFSKITISVFDTPNYKQNKEVIPGVSGRAYEARIARRYGKESNYYKARVLGQIPTEDVDAIIHISDLEDAYNRHFTIQRTKRKFIAGDPADGGDESVFYYMEETDILDELIFTKKNTMITAGKVKIFAEKHKTNWYVGDSIGIGAGVCDRLGQMGMKVVRVNSAERQQSNVPELYYNRRAQMWLEGGELFSMGDIDLNYKDEVLGEQLIRIKQTVKAGRILVQPKDIIRKELGRSPDRADAYIIGLYGRRFVKTKKKERPDRWDPKPARTTAMSG